ncbi:hypothetical protein BDR07DRAFT_1376328 [Suillus spraguei]|nr:hypothetical protein BDR07DRAFT_1376328 [Suillus spraguei]
MARKYDWDHTLQDAIKSISIQPSLMGYISKGIALCRKGLVWDARAAFNVAFMYTVHFLLLIKAITLFNADKHEEVNLLLKELAAGCPNADTCACYIVQAYLRVQLRIKALTDARHDEAVDQFITAVNSSNFSSRSPIHLIYEDLVVLFGWDLKSLWQTACQKQCDALLQAGKLQEAMKSYQYMMALSDENTKADFLDWSNSKSGVPNAIDLYSAAIDLASVSNTVFANHSMAKLGKGMWIEALLDAQNSCASSISVHLKGALARSVWNKRGWTFQEFVAPKVVIFYQKDWSLYLDDQSFNHKESFAIMKELEDIAYSLFGIFSVHLPVIYGKKKQNALGQLLQEIVARSGDITVLDWIGQPSEFNSCLPAYITSYTTPPRTFPSLSEDEIQTFLALLLHLPCITFHVTDISLSYGPSQQTHSMYEIKADGLHNLLITTKEPISQTRLTRQTFVLVRPWDGSLIELPDFGDFPSGDDVESEGDYWTPPSSPSDDSPGRSFLKQEPFSVFMLEQQHGGEYKRVASDHDIIAQVVKGMTSVPDLMDIKTIEILTGCKVIKIQSQGYVMKATGGGHS